jgi:hypothetical protein
VVGQAHKGKWKRCLTRNNHDARASRAVILVTRDKAATENSEEREMTDADKGFLLAYIDASFSKAAQARTSIDTAPSEELARGGLSAIWSKLADNPNIRQNLLTSLESATAKKRSRI